MSDRQPVSFNQNRRLALEEGMARRGERARPFNLAMALRLRASVGRDHVCEALDYVVSRHPALRATYEPSLLLSDREREAEVDRLRRTGVCVPDLFRQVVHARGRCRFEEYSAGTTEAIEAAGRQLLAESRNSVVPHALSACLCGSSATPLTLVLCLPHLVCDARSMQIITRDIAAYLYDAPPPQPVADRQTLLLDAAIEHGALGVQFDASGAYWRSQWDEFEAYQPKQSDFHDNPIRSHLPMIAQVRHDLTDSLPALHRATRFYRVSLYMLCLWAVSTTISTLLRRRRFVLWGHLPNRPLPGSDDAVGWFTHTHMFGVDMAAGHDIASQVARSREAVLTALRHQSFPLGLLWHRVGRRMEQGPRVVVQVIDHREDDTSAGNVVRIPMSCNRKRKVDIDFEMHIYRNSLVIELGHSIAIVSYTTAQSLLRTFVSSLAALCASVPSQVARHVTAERGTPA